MPDHRAPLILFMSVLAISMLAANASAGQACYIISNFAQHQYANITLNGSFFMERVNFIGPDTAGVSINDNASYTLALNQSQIVNVTPYYIFSTELINVTWLPVEHTITLTFCSDPNNSSLNQSNSNATTTVPQFSTTITLSTVTLTSTIRPSTTSTLNQSENSISVLPPVPEHGLAFWLNKIIPAVLIAVAVIVGLVMVYAHLKGIKGIDYSKRGRN